MGFNLAFKGLNADKYCNLLVTLRVNDVDFSLITLVSTISGNVEQDDQMQESGAG
jgi:hypothetical protein